VNFRNTRGRQREEPTLEITPLIDVVFLLLLFFLITSNFVRENNTQLPLDLPAAGSGDSASDTDRTIIFVGAGGELQIDDEQIRDTELKARLEALHAKTPDVHLLIKGDKATNYGRITEIIDTAKEVGFRRVNLVVKPKR